MPVFDASALFAYVVASRHQEPVRARILGARDGLWAPHLVDAEVGHAVRRSARIGEISAAVGRAALQDLAALPLQRMAHARLLSRAWELRENVSFYDALYVALAERLETPLVTLDRRLAGAKRIRAQIDLVA